MFLLYIFIGPPHKFLQVKGNLIMLHFFAMLFSLLLYWPVSPYQSGIRAKLLVVVFYLLERWRHI